MKSPPTLLALFFALGVARAAPAPATANPAPLTAAIATPAPPPSKLAQETDAVLEKILAKTYSAYESAEDLAPELKALDDLLAAHAGEKTDDAARVLLLKAGVYAKYIGNQEKALPLYNDVIARYPDTASAQAAKDFLPNLAAFAEDAALRHSLVAGKVFPDFSAKDLQGAPLSVARFQGKVVLVDFWATWCTPCLVELPAIKKLYDRYHASGFEIIGIALDATADKAKLLALLAEQKITWPQYFDGLKWDSPLARKYGVRSIPSNILVDRDGKIIGRQYQGPALAEAVAQAMAASPRK